MRIELKLLATFHQYLPPEAQGSVCELEVSAGTRAIEVLSSMGVPVDRPETIVILVNGRNCQPDHVLETGNVLCAFSAIAGGYCC
jgi:hypothetical protein